MNYHYTSELLVLGCGNGMMLIELAREGYTHLTGVDFSPKAIDLSRKIAADQAISICYKVADLLHDEFPSEFDPFHVVHDKGIFQHFNLRKMNNSSDTRHRHI